MSWTERAQRIRAIVVDVDGVLTDGKLGYTPDGDVIKFFHVRDGQAMRLALEQGLLVGMLSGRADEAALARAKELALSFARVGCGDKLSGFHEILREHGLSADECAYVGDDLSDLGPIRAAGIGAAPADALGEVLEAADLTLTTAGGHGAIWELVVALLRARGSWPQI